MPAQTPPASQHASAEGGQTAPAVPAGEEPAQAPSSAQSEHNSAPDRWRFSWERGACYVQAIRPDVELTEVEDAIRAWPLNDYQRDALRIALSSPGADPVLIGRITPPDDADSEATFFLNVTPDGMTAWLVPNVPGAVSEEDLRRELRRQEIVLGVDEKALADVLGGVFDRPAPLARGAQGTPSRDAAVEALFSEEADEDELHPLIREDGSVDYRELKPVHTVPAGTVVGRYLPGVDGEPARDVRGHEVAAVRPGRKTPARSFAGRNVEVAENGIDLVATKPGRPTREGARIEIEEVYAVSGDVDFSTGNVTFTGEVFVSGNVKPGFSVKATGNVRIGGMVDGGHVQAGKDVIVGGGIQGHGESVIACGRDLSALFVDSAEVRADGAVLIYSTIVRGTVASGAKVTVLGRGSILGGKVKAVTGIRCNSVGSPAGVPTSLELDWLEALKPGMDLQRELPRYRATKIVVYGDIFPGAMITINGAKFPVRDHLRGAQFQAADRGIAVSSAR